MKRSANYPAQSSLRRRADWKTKWNVAENEFNMHEWFIGATFSPHVEHFTCVVKMLYNLQFIQALAALSSKFSPEERQAWSSTGALKKVKVKSR